MIFVPKKSNIYNDILRNKKYFVSCVVSSKLTAKQNFSEIICLNKKFIEISRISKINTNKKNNLYLIELTFKSNENLKKQLNKFRMQEVLKPIFTDNAKSLKIIDYKITRLVFFPQKKDIKKAINLVNKFIKNISNKKNKIFCNISFGPINMAKAWIASETNIKILK